jgi:hypothetical protein
MDNVNYTNLIKMRILDVDAEILICQGSAAFSRQQGITDSCFRGMEISLQAEKVALNKILDGKYERELA